ncbi:MAG: formylglycine-generating enzyme family protein [Pirellulales bacterium]
MCLVAILGHGTAAAGQANKQQPSPAIEAAAAPVESAAVARRYALQRPVPDESQVAELLPIIREAYHDGGVDGAGVAEDPINTMLAAAEHTADPVKKYALLVSAESVAFEQAAHDRVFQLLNERAAQFAINLLAERLGLLRRIAKSRSALDAEYFRIAMATARMALDAEDFEAADDAVYLADQAAKALLREQRQAGPQAGDRSIEEKTNPTAEVISLRKDIKSERKLAAAYLKAKAHLQEDPDDAKAAITIGRHLCFIKGRWSDGLAFLSKDDTPAGGIARAELALLQARDLDPQAAFGLAGTWWEFSTEEYGASALHADQARIHAAWIYTKIAGALSDPLDAALAKKRSAQTGQQPPRPGSEPWFEPHWAGDIATNSLGMQLVLVPAGSFWMGSPAGEARRGPDEEHVKVTLSRPFLLGQTEVTQGQWQELMGTEPWKDKPMSVEASEQPATYITWDAALAFCRRLTERERQAGQLPLGVSYSLPSEAEWEYACRAGSAAAFCFGDNEQLYIDYGWATGFFEHNALRAAKQVARKQANAFGLYDMHGNVWEWCLDGYEKSLPGGVDPVRSPSGSPLRVVRGGSWNFDAFEGRCANRQSIAPERPDFFDGGFRVIRTIVTDGVTASFGERPRQPKERRDTVDD